ncbi:MAG: MSCRAMM family protein [Candidatus Ranarchaeia archaeon]
MKTRYRLFISGLLIISFIFVANLALFSGMDDASLSSLNGDKDGSVPMLGAPGVDKTLWWNTSWNFRVGYNVSAGAYNQVDVPTVLDQINFTEVIDEYQPGESLDVDSIRLVEYKSNDYIEYSFDLIEGANFNKTTNAVYSIGFLLNGTTPASSVRRYYVYFDTESNGPKAAPVLDNAALMALMKPTSISGDVLYVWLYTSWAPELIVASNFTIEVPYYVPFNVCIYDKDIDAGSVGATFNLYRPDGSLFGEVGNASSDTFSNVWTNYTIIPDAVGKWTINITNAVDSSQENFMLATQGYVNCYQADSSPTYNSASDFNVWPTPANVTFYAYLSSSISSTDFSTLDMDNSGTMTIYFPNGTIYGTGTVSGAGEGGVWVSNTITTGGVEGWWMVEVYEASAGGWKGKWDDVPTFYELPGLWVPENSPVITQDVSSTLFAFQIHVQDLNGETITGANVTLYNSTAPYDVIPGESKLTDINGNVTFVGLINDTYRIKTWINTSWLDTNLKVVNITNMKPELGFYTELTVIVDVADLNLELTDLDDAAMAASGDETIRVRLRNSTNDIIHTTVLPNSTGWNVISRVPKDDYTIELYYANASSGALYGWTIFTQTCSYSISSSEFVSDITKSGADGIVFPLSRLDVNVTSYDDLAINDATVTLENQNVSVFEDYQYEGDIGIAGIYRFDRILNGTWLIEVERTDSYGQQVSNDTKEIDVQTFSTQLIEFPMTRFTIEVVDKDNPNQKIEGATVKINLTDTIIATGQTNSSGQITFHHLRANDYGINVTAGITGNDTIVSFLMSTNWDSYPSGLQIKVPAPLYDQQFTTFVNQNASSSYVFYYNDTFVLSIEYVNRTGSASTYSNDTIAYDGTTYVYFRIYGGLGYSTLIQTLSWTVAGPSNVSGSGGSKLFNATIPTRLLNLEASATYLVQVTAHTDGYSDPEPYDYYISIDKTPISVSNLNDITLVWSQGADEYFTVTDTEHSLVVSELDTYNYSIQLQGINAFLQKDANGSYYIPASFFNTLDAGTYSLRLTFNDNNYVSHSELLTLTINPMPTNLTWVQNISSTYQFGDGVSRDAVIEWRDDNDIMIGAGTVTIQFRIIPLSPGYSIITQVGTSYTLSIDSLLLGNGSWVIEVSVAKDNHVSKVSNSSVFVVQPVAVTMTTISPVSVTVDWSEVAAFNFMVNRTDSDAPVSDFVLNSHNWSSGVNLYQLGDGQYRLEALTSIPSNDYAITFQLINGNHTSIRYTFDISILLPPVIEGELGSIESPYTAYWTSTFTLNVTVWDGSRVNTPLSGGDVRFVWNTGSTQGQLSEVLLGRYQYTVDADLVSPGLYSLIVLANTTDSSLGNKTFYVLISSVPSAIEIPASQEANVHLEYELSATYGFYWDNTLDDLGIASPDSVTVSLQGIGNLSTVVDQNNGSYVFAVDSFGLGLSAGESYLVQIYATKDGYTTPTGESFSIIVDATQTQLSVGLSYTEVEQGRIPTVLITAFYNRTHNGTGISGANLTTTFNNEIIVMTDHNNGTYTCEITANTVNIGSYAVSVNAGKDNYQVKDTQGILDITEQTINLLFLKVTVSQFMIGVGGIFLPIAIFASVIAYKRITLPYPLKIMNKAIKLMQSGGAYDTEAIKLTDREARIKDLLKDDFEVLDELDKTSTPVESTEE